MTQTVSESIEFTNVGGYSSPVNAASGEDHISVKYEWDVYPKESYLQPADYYQDFYSSADAGLDYIWESERFVTFGAEDKDFDKIVFS